MKKLLLLTLMVLMILSICACNSTPPPDTEAYADMGSVGEILHEADLYRQYRAVINFLEQKNFNAAITEILRLADAERPKEEPTPLSAYLTGQWYLGSNSNKQASPQTLNVEKNGSVTINGENFSWLERYSSDTELSGYLLKDGVHRYSLRVVKEKDKVVPYIYLHTVEVDGDSVVTRDSLGTYYNQPMLGSLLKSWNNLDPDGKNSPIRNFYIDNRNANVNATEYEWTITDSREDRITVTLGEAYTLTVEDRGENDIAFLTDKDGFTQAYYADYYDRNWLEYIYPRAIQYLNECLEDVKRGDNAYFTSHLEEKTQSFSDNEAWKKLYEIFESLGDYRDSAEHLARFTVLKEMYTEAKVTRINHMGNTSTSTLESHRYDSAGRIIYGYSADIFRMYGLTDGRVYFFYKEDGSLDTVQSRSGENVYGIVTLEYDGRGIAVGGTYKNNSGTQPVSYTYDSAGRLEENIVWVSDSRYKSNYSYDGEGRLTRIVTWYGWRSDNDYKETRYTTNFTYDANGFLVGSVKVEESYSNYNETFTLQYTTAYAYTNDSAGRPLSAELTVTNREGKSEYASQDVVYTYTDLYFYN